MSVSGRIAVFLMLSLLTITFAWTAPTLGAELPESVVLVATPQFQDPLYGQSILIATSLDNGQHVGFILNKPTEASLAEVLPTGEASTKLTSPLYFGGPADLSDIFALVQSDHSPGDGSVQIAPNLFLVSEQATLAHLLGSDDGHTRFLLGAVIWSPGELREELQRGAWYVMESPEPELLFRSKTSGLWEELVHRAEMRANGI